MKINVSSIDAGLVNWFFARKKLDEKKKKLVKLRHGQYEQQGVDNVTLVCCLKVSMLPSPYGDCRPNANYTFMRCYTQCMGDYVVSVCKCRPVQLVGMNP